MDRPSPPGAFWHRPRKTRHCDVELIAGSIAVIRVTPTLLFQPVKRDRQKARSKRTLAGGGLQSWRHRLGYVRRRAFRVSNFRKYRKSNEKAYIQRRDKYNRYWLNKQEKPMSTSTTI